MIRPLPFLALVLVASPLPAQRVSREVPAGGDVAPPLAFVAPAHQPGFRWDIPAEFPKPYVPADNPMNAAKVELGRRLFYDQRMSVNGQQSCGSCHRQELAFTDGRARSVGTTGELHPRGSTSLANVAYNPRLIGTHPTLGELEGQAFVPLLGTDPIELGMKGHEERFLAEVQRDPAYQRLFPLAFGDSRPPYTMANVVRAIAAFERTIVSMQSPYDRYRFGGDSSAISAAAKRGEAVFFGERAACSQCHGGWNFNGEVRVEGGPVTRARFFDTGRSSIADESMYAARNLLASRPRTKLPGLVARVPVPTLRNIAVTAPYMHDGRIATLSEVLERYTAGGRTLARGLHANAGHAGPNGQPMVRDPLSSADREDLIAFLESLTDTEFLRNPALSDPFDRGRIAQR